MGWTRAKYRRQPAREVIRWRAMQGVENEAMAERRELERLRASMGVTSGRGN